jgi:hypothetical protein
MPNQPEVIVSSNEARFVNRDSRNEIDQSIIRLMDICESIQMSADQPQAIRAICVSYEGCGDDGEVLSVDYLCSSSFPTSPPGSCEEAGTIIPPATISYDNATLERSKYEKMIQDEAFAVAYNAHGEWFNNIGGNGFLIIDLERSIIQGEHIQYAEGESEDLADTNAPYYYVLRRSVYNV